MVISCSWENGVGVVLVEVVVVVLSLIVPDAIETMGVSGMGNFPTPVPDPDPPPAPVPADPVPVAAIRSADMSDADAVCSLFIFLLWHATRQQASETTKCHSNSSNLRINGLDWDLSDYPD